MRRRVAIASAGLAARGRVNVEGVDERVYLSPLEESIASGMSPAERLLAEYEADWRGDIGEVFRRHAY